MRALLVMLVLCAVADAAPRKVAQEGRSIVFVVDRGLSEAKIEIVRKAVKEAAPFDTDQIGVVAYDAKAAMVVRPFRGGKSPGVPSTTEPTNLAVGLEAAHAMLLKSKRAGLVIVVTDTDDTTGIAPVITKLRYDNAAVSAVGVGGTNERALKTIATLGNGRYYTTDVAAAFQREFKRPPPGEETFAYVVVIDRSMGLTQLELAKELARVRLEAATPNDFVAVVAFDTTAALQVRAQRAANRMRISHDVSRLTTASSGSPKGLQSGLQLAFDTMKSLSMSDKHVIVYGTGHGDDVVDLVKDMAAADITVSAVGVQGADADVLTKIVQAGHGQLHMSDGMTLRMR